MSKFSKIRRQIKQGKGPNLVDGIPVRPFCECGTQLEAGKRAGSLCDWCTSNQKDEVKGRGT